MADISKRKTLRGHNNIDLDKVVCEWFCQHRREGIPILGPMLMEKAKSYHEELKIEGDCNYSMGWLQKFKNRHGIRYSHFCHFFFFFLIFVLFRFMISKIRKNRLSGAGQAPDIPDKRSSTVYMSTSTASGIKMYTVQTFGTLICITPRVSVSNSSKNNSVMI
jgi:hypothetical protein